MEVLSSSALNFCFTFMILILLFSLNLASVPKKKDEPSLFGNDEDSDDDIFKTLVTSRKSTTVAKDPNVSSIITESLMFG